MDNEQQARYHAQVYPEYEVLHTADLVTVQHRLGNGAVMLVSYKTDGDWLATLLKSVLAYDRKYVQAQQARPRAVQSHNAGQGHDGQGQA